MTNYKFLTGPFQGSVVEEDTEILDVDFSELDDDLQIRIREWADSQLKRRYIQVDGGCDFALKIGSGNPLSLNEIKQDYEHSWESEETEEEVDLLPVSEW